MTVAPRSDPPTYTRPDRHPGDVRHADGYWLRMIDVGLRGTAHGTDLPGQHGTLHLVLCDGNKARRKGWPDNPAPISRCYEWLARGPVHRIGLVPGHLSANGRRLVGIDLDVPNAGRDAAGGKTYGPDFDTPARRKAWADARLAELRPALGWHSGVERTPSGGYHLLAVVRADADVPPRWQHGELFDRKGQLTLSPNCTTCPASQGPKRK